MRSFYHDIKGNYREGNIVIFLECCVDNYIQIIENKSELEKVFGREELWIVEDGKSFLNPDIDTDRVSKLTKNNHKLVIQSIITLTTFIESFINEIGMVELGSKYYKDNLDTLSIISKWEIVLRIIYGKSLNKGLKYYENIKNLISARNSLVHYKSKIADINNLAPLDYYEKILIDSVSSLPLLFEDFEELNKTKNLISTIEIKSQFSRIK